MNTKPFQIGGDFRSFDDAADFLRSVGDADYRVRCARRSGGPPRFLVLRRPGR